MYMSATKIQVNLRELIFLKLGFCLRSLVPKIINQLQVSVEGQACLKRKKDILVA